MDGGGVEINVRQAGEITIMDIKGALVLGDPADEVRSQAQQLLQSGQKNIAVNLGEVTQMDSSGLGVLLRAHNAFKQAGGKIKVYAVPKRVMQLFKMVRMDTVFDISEDEASALSGF
jgi:anti-sigma B factor antagonist